jgi:hypothetical protein
MNERYKLDCNPTLQNALEYNTKKFNKINYCGGTFEIISRAL